MRETRTREGLIQAMIGYYERAVGGALPQPFPRPTIEFAVPTPVDPANWIVREWEDVPEPGDSTYWSLVMETVQVVRRNFDLAE